MTKTMEKEFLCYNWWRKAMAAACCVLLVAVHASAYDLMLDGIAYNVNSDSTSLTVTYTELCSPNNYSDVTSIVIPSKLLVGEKLCYVSAIGDFAFSGSQSLQSVTISESVSHIGDRAFAHCPALDSIKVDEENPYFDSRFDCDAIIDTETETFIAGCHNSIIPADVTSIEAFAFSGCTQLTEIEIPESVSRIGYEAFEGCGLTSVFLPFSVEYLGYRVFANCPDLTTITVGPESWTFDSRDSCNAVIETATNTLVAGCKESVIPETVSKIGYEAFSGCVGLIEMVIPDSVVAINHYAFRDCADLQMVDISSTVSSFGDRAFGDCSQLKKVYARLEHPEEGYYYDYSTFQGVDVNTCLLLVDAGRIDIYRVTAPWKDFLMIRDFDHEFLRGDVTGDGKVDVADVNAIINIILEIKTQSDYPGNADLNEDGKVDVSDVNEVINIILSA